EPWVAFLELRRARRQLRIAREGAPIQLRQSGPFGGVGDDQKMPALGVGTGGRLERDIEAAFQNLRIDRSLEIKALAHRTSGGEQMIDASQIHVGHSFLGTTDSRTTDNRL